MEKKVPTISSSYPPTIPPNRNLIREQCGHQRIPMAIRHTSPDRMAKYEWIHGFVMTKQQPNHTSFLWSTQKLNKIETCRFCGDFFIKTTCFMIFQVLKDIS